ncbi:hypothetical protein [Halorussus pelagicus]|uniref:hypothetical protein n=1 Tax=Halorussus pelagicus TaxID=2505977 RepID=UPI001FB602D3|nr:hypothetical protein [Halorussus pelagicus]
MLTKTLEAIGDENDEFADRVLSSIDSNDKDRLPDKVLKKLVNHFTAYRYRNEGLRDPDSSGRAYEYLIRQFADDAGKKATSSTQLARSSNSSSNWSLHLGWTSCDITLLMKI